MQVFVALAMFSIVESMPTAPDDVVSEAQGAYSALPTPTSVKRGDDLLPLLPIGYEQSRSSQWQQQPQPYNPPPAAYPPGAQYGYPPPPYNPPPSLYQGPA